jgi:hypothetical protein
MNVIEKESYACISVLNSHESCYVFKHENLIYPCIPLDLPQNGVLPDATKLLFSIKNQTTTKFIATNNGHESSYLFHLVKEKWETFILFHQSMAITPYYKMIPYQTFQVHIYDIGQFVNPLMMVPSQYIFREGFQQILGQIQQAQDGLLKWLIKP